MKLVNILSEIEFLTYEGQIRVSYGEDINSNDVAEIFRALPGVTTVTNAGDLGAGTVSFKVKLISQKSGEEAFQALADNATKKYGSVVSNVDVGTETIEEK